MSTLTDRLQTAIRERYAARSKDAPGQRDLLSGQERRSKKTQGKLRWITLKNDDGSGGAHVQIDGDGNIKAGPKGLAEKGITNLSDFGEKKKPAAKVPAKKDSDVSTQLTDLLSDGKNRSHREIQQQFAGQDISRPLDALAKAGTISKAYSRSGDHSYWMSEEQQANHGDRDADNAADAADGAADSGVREGAAGDAADTGSTPEVTTHPDAPAAGREPGSPREYAAQVTERMVDEEYAYARKSKVRNAGEDLLGSARHKANAWRGLADAEENGTAENLVTRTNLAKNEPHGLAGVISDEPQNHLSAAAMALVLKKFPAKPGPKNARQAARRSEDDQKRDRQDYVEAWETLRSRAEEIARTEADPMQAADQMRSAIKSHIYKLRGQSGHTLTDAAAATNRYNNTANLLVDMYRGIGSTRYERRSTAVTSQIKELQEYGQSHPDFDTVDAAMRVTEGAGIKKVLGTTSAAVRRVSPADLYVTTKASRKGGRDISRQTGTATKATDYLTNNVNIRGVQFGNSVTDDEREHHVRRTAEAFADLADVLGMKPEDISLDGSLGIAFGARGKGSASAHYEPGSKVINLTRKNGVGTLAHEWGHALDHYLTGGKLVADHEGRLAGDYMSGRTSAKRFKMDDNGRPVLDENRQAQYDDHSDEPVWKAMDGVRKAWMESGFRKRVGAQMSKLAREKRLWKDTNYWGSPHELLARSFERHVQHALGEDGRENTYLSGLPHESSDGGTQEYLNLWPTKEEAAAMAPAFETLLKAVRKKRYGTTDKQKYSKAAAVRRFTEILHAACRTDRYSFDESKHPRAADGRFGNKASEQRATQSKFGSDDGRLPHEDNATFDKRMILERGDDNSLRNVAQRRDYFRRKVESIEWAENENRWKSDRQREMSLREAEGLRHELAWLDDREKQLIDKFDADYSVISALQDSGKPMTTMDLAHSLDVQSKHIDSALRGLVQDGEIYKVGNDMYSMSPATPPKRPGVAGMQMGLFDEEPSGQKTLFNVVQPATKKKQPAPSTERSLLETIADGLKQRSHEMKPITGQRELFSMAATNKQVERYELAPSRRRPETRTQPQTTVPKRQPGDGTPGWQRVGGAPVFVNGDGKITKGCPGLKGEHVADIIDEEDDSRDRREARQAHAKAEGIDGKEYSAKDRRRHESAKSQAMHRNAKAAAKQNGVSTVKVLQHMPAVHAMNAGHDAEWEHAKQRARKVTGMTAGRIASVENGYRDHSTVDGFDANAREFASEFPHLFDPDDADTPAKVWEFIREGAGEADRAHFEETAQAAAERVAQTKRGSDPFANAFSAALAEHYEDDDDAPF